MQAHFNSRLTCILHISEEILHSWEHADKISVIPKFWPVKNFYLTLWSCFSHHHCLCWMSWSPNFVASHMNLSIIIQNVPEVVSICKKCISPKPPRAHHCSVCGKCILKMDHHCRILYGQCYDKIVLFAQNTIC